MTLNLDDPLAGILSDGSDDSFFDDDILGKKKLPKKKTTPVLEKKSSLFDFKNTEEQKSTVSISESKKEALFDLGGDNKNNSDEIKAPKTTPPTNIKGTISKESFKIPSVDTKLKTLDVIKSPAKSKVSADKHDILSEIGSDKNELTKTLEKGKSSQSILDDILGGTSGKASGSSHPTKPTTVAKSQDFDFDSFLGKADSKPKNVSKPSSKHSIKADPPKSDKNPKQENTKKKPSDDWLGIFQEKNEFTEEASGMPSWLVGADAKNKKEEKPQHDAKEIPQVEIERKIPEEREKEVHKVDNPPIVEHFSKVAIAPFSVLQGNNEDITSEGATLYLQQQESQLMVAMQLKAQEEKLAAMQSNIFLFSLPTITFLFRALPLGKRIVTTVLFAITLLYPCTTHVPLYQPYTQFIIFYPF